MRTAFYFCRVRNDNFITEFCVANHQGDPSQYVCTLAPDGSEQKWDCREDGDLLVFTPPDGYDGNGLLWRYDPALQKGQRAPLEVLERQLLRNRKSLIVPGLRGS